MAVKITCIKKASGDHENPYVAISSLGWVNEESGTSGSTSRIDMYAFIEDKGGIAYVKDAYGNKANLTTAISPKGTKYVKTIADYTKTDNLLQLPECQ